MRLAIKLIVCVWLVSCAHPQTHMVSGPNSAALHASISDTQNAVHEAKDNNDQSVKLSTTIRDKDELINAYHKWKLTHP